MRESIIRWTCDRCGTTTEKGSQPERWSGLLILPLPESAVDHPKARRVHLCGECGHDLGFFLNPPELADEGNNK